jgi:peptidoglycan/xylan/chitin deacetylase (PgdA/CDA1 family)
MATIEVYKDIKKQKPEGFRGFMRARALDGLSAFDKLKGIEEDLNKPRIQFLYVHHVFRDEEKNFDVLLKRLSANHTFISYSEAVSRILEQKIDKPYICISSDDGFRNNMGAAAVMNNYGAKGCFFINPAVIGEQSFSKIESHCRERLSFPPVDFLNWQEVEQLQKMGHEIGSHTMEHIDVAKTREDLFAEDCAKTFAILTSRCGEVRHFAFPYGRFVNFNEMGRKAVFNAGFISCATAERGCHINPERKMPKEELCILRDHIILDWNIDHIFHFLVKNSRRATVANNFYPYSAA